MVKLPELISKLKEVGISTDLYIDRSSGYWVCKLYGRRGMVQAGGTTNQSALFAAMIEAIRYDD